MKTRLSRQQVSSGGVIFRPTPEGKDVALIRRTSSEERPVWCLPKGWVEPGESLEGTAIREVQEETGLAGKVLQKLGAIQYSFLDRRFKSRIHKTVHFYLLEYIQGDPSQHDHEVEEARWVRLDEARGFLTYDGEKEIVSKAIITL